MKYALLYALITTTALSACAGEEPIPDIRVSEYEAYIQESETSLSEGASLVLAYLGPRDKRSCRNMYIRLSRLEDTGLEKRWEPMEFVEVDGVMGGAPVNRRTIGAFPVLFALEETSSYRVDGLACDLYNGEMSIQYGEQVRFTPQPGKVSYLGHFRQSRLSDTTDIYVLDGNLETHAAALADDSPALHSALIATESPAFTFQSYDGQQMTTQQLLDNVGRSGDYYAVSSDLRQIAFDAIDAFAPVLTSLSVSQGFDMTYENRVDILENELKKTFAYADMYQGFEAVLAAGKPYDTAVDYANLMGGLYNARNEDPRLKIKPRNLHEDYVPVSERKPIDEKTQFIAKHRLKRTLGFLSDKDRLARRQAWLDETPKLARLLSTEFSSQTDQAKRDRALARIESYIPAKYEALRDLYAGFTAHRDVPPNVKRQLKRSLDRAEKLELAAITQRLTGFLNTNLYEDKDYQDANAEYDAVWQEILILRQRIFNAVE